jgi:hypothetical protein
VPQPRATGWRREWSRGNRGPKLTFDDLSLRTGRGDLESHRYSSRFNPAF